MKTKVKAELTVADAIKAEVAGLQQAYDDGRQASMIDLFDVIELLLRIAERIEKVAD